RVGRTGGGRKRMQGFGVGHGRRSGSGFTATIADFAYASRAPDASTAGLESIRPERLWCMARRHPKIAPVDRMLQTPSHSQAGPPPPLPSTRETGILGVYQLKRAWARQLAKRQGHFEVGDREFHTDHLVFDALGIGLEQTIEFLGDTGPS